jgi:hypothetical protein
VSLDPELEHKILDNVLDEPHRAIVTTPGVDLVTVLKYALAAHRRRVMRDVVLLTDLCTLIIIVIVLFRLPAAFLAFVLLMLVGAWAVVLAEGYVTLYGSVMRSLWPGAFDPQRAPSPTSNSFADGQLKRVAAADKDGNVTLYSWFSPFVGYGQVQTSWSFAVDITKPRADNPPKPFTVREVYEYIKTGLLELDLPGIEITDRLFVDGSDIQGDRRFLPQPGGPPVISVSPDLIQDLMAAPEERARPYLTISMTGWQGDLVVTTFLRLLLSRTDLFVEAAHTVVPPIRTEFKAMDRRDPRPTLRDFVVLAGSSLLYTIPRLFGSMAGIVHELRSDSRREKKRRRSEKAGDYGALFSIREAATAWHWQRYFQVFDDARYVKVIEQRIFRSLLEFLEDHGIDTSSLESRTEMLINNGVMVTGKATVQADQIAAGAGAQAAGRISHVGATEGAGSAEG